MEQCQKKSAHFRSYISPINGHNVHQFILNNPGKTGKDAGYFAALN